MLDDQSWRWLVRYLADECSEQEKRSIEQWITSDAKLREEVAYLRKIWRASSEEKEDWDVDRAWERFRSYDVRFARNKQYQKAANIHKLPGKIDRDFQSKPFHRRDRMYKWVTLVTAIAAGIVIGFLFFQPTKPPSISGKSAMRVIKAHKGERVHLVLADGTKILLNADSRIKIPRHFSDSTRDVYLKGEAYFEVAHKKDQPFRVHAGNTVTRDLSTRFVVVSYPGSEGTRVIVTEGKVAMHNSAALTTSGHSRVIISSNHIGILKKDGTMGIKPVKNIMNWIGWTEGKLVFNNTPLAQVLPQLDRWYDLNITLKDSTIATRRLTATYVDRQPMGEVLDALALSLDLKYSLKDRSVELYAKK